MPAQSNPTKRAGLWMAAVGVAVIALALFGELSILGLARIDASLSQLLSALSAQQQDLWILTQAGMGAFALLGGVFLLLAGWVVVKLSERVRPDAKDENLHWEEAA